MTVPLFMDAVLPLVLQVLALLVILSLADKSGRRALGLFPRLDRLKVFISFGGMLAAIYIRNHILLESFGVLPLHHNIIILLRYGIVIGALAESYLIVGYVRLHARNRQLEILLNTRGRDE